jgi:hypothetical protein
MENFTNETIDIAQLPQFEAVLFTKMHPLYWKQILIHIVLLFLILGIGLVIAFVFIKELAPNKMEFTILLITLFLIVLGLSRLGFSKKGYAFRTHDVLFRSGIIATNTIVIPYNRIQHVSLHEGIVSRLLGLAKIEIFTAGSSSSDIHIPGLEKGQAEKIKQLLMGKIQKEL